MNKMKNNYERVRERKTNRWPDFENMFKHEDIRVYGTIAGKNYTEMEKADIKEFDGIEFMSPPSKVTKSNKDKTRVTLRSITSTPFYAIVSRKRSRYGRTYIVFSNKYVDITDKIIEAYIAIGSCLKSIDSMYKNSTLFHTYKQNGNIRVCEFCGKKQYKKKKIETTYYWSDKKD